MKYINDNGELERLESSVIKGIIEQAFHEELVHEHNKASLKFKKDRKADVLASYTANCSELNYAVYFNSAKMLKDRLGFLQNFIEGEFEFCHQFGDHNRKPKNPKCLESSFLTDLRRLDSSRKSPRGEGAERNPDKEEDMQEQSIGDNVTEVMDRDNLDLK